MQALFCGHNPQKIDNGNIHLPFFTESVGNEISSGYSGMNGSQINGLVVAETIPLIYFS